MAATFKESDWKIGRWTLILQQYNFDSKYRKGVLNKVADALSRQSTLHPDSLYTKTVAILQQAGICSWYLKMYDGVKENPEWFSDYCIRDQKLYRPKETRTLVLKKNYDELAAGNLGIPKTAARIVRHYYWPSMFRDIAKYVRQCKSCQQFKISQQKPSGD